MTAVAQKPELVVQTGHSREVVSVTFSPDGKTLASVGWDDTIKLWDVTSGRELRSLPEQHAGFIRSVAFSPKGDTLVSISALNVVTIWNVGSGKPITAQKYPDSIGSVVFSKDGQTMALAAIEGGIKLIEVATGKVLRNMAEGSSPVSFSPDGKTLATGDRDRSIKLWDLASGREILTLLGDLRGIISLAFSADGRTLAGGSHDQTVRVWDVVSGAERQTLLGHTGDVNSVVFCAEGTTLASASKDKTIKLWDVASGTELKTLVGHSDEIHSLAVSPDGKTLASASSDHTVELWDVSSGQARTLSGHSEPLNAVAFSTDGKLLATGGGNTIKIWDLTTGSLVRTFAGHRETVWAVAFSADNSTLASGSKDRTIKLWEIGTGKELQTLSGHSDDVFSVAFSPDGKSLASGSWDKTIKLWEVATGKEMQTLSGHSNRLTAVAFSIDGKTLASASDDHTVRLWEVATGKLLQTLSGHKDLVRSIAFNKDGRTVASSSWDNTIKLWDLVTGRELKSLTAHPDRIKSVGPGMVAPTISNSVVFSPDGKTLLSGNNDATIITWDVATGRQLRILYGHSDHIGAVAFRSHGRMLASIGNDQTVELWDANSGDELATLIAVDKEDWVVTTADGLFDGSAAAWNQILWRFNQQTFDVAPVEIFFNEFFYPGLLSDIVEGKRPRAPQGIAAKDRRQPQITLTLSDAATAKKAAAARTNGESIKVTPEEMASLWRQVRGWGNYNVTVKIDISEAPAGAQDVRLFRNGSLVKVWRGDVLAAQTSAALYATIPIVSGENRLTAYAFNRDNIKSGDASIAVTGPESKNKGTAYVLAVGINEYANAQYNLKYAVADAQDFGEETRIQQTKLSNYARVEVISLNDREATKIKILGSLQSLASKVQPEDAVIIFFAGHGTAQSNRFYLIPHDLGYEGDPKELSREGLQSILSHSISDEELERAVESIHAGQLIFVIDACNSGQALEAEEKRRGPMNSKGLAQLAYEKGMYILTAAQSYQAANEAERYGHGFLTYALVEEGLKTNAADREPRDGQVLLREWLDFATGRVPQMQQDKLEEQKKQGRQLDRIKFAEADSGTERNIQRPRVFYRRETETHPLVVARP
jgi:WD40 repeat protein/uncharacterized caspase-like protein